MSYTHRLTREAGHPFTGEAGWDLLEVGTDTPDELDAYVVAAGRKFWQVWLRGSGPLGEHCAVLYKPRDAAVAWVDVPGGTPVARLLDSLDMKAAQAHIDIVLAALGHHLRCASSRGEALRRSSQAVHGYGSTGKAAADAAAGLTQALPLLNRFLEQVAASTSEDWRREAAEHLANLTAAVASGLDGIPSHSPLVDAAPRVRRAVRRT